MADGGEPNETLADQLVLIVEDSYFVAQYLMRTVRRAGGEVLGPARSMQDAHWLIDVQRPDLAVLDLGLPDGNSLPIADRLDEDGVSYCFFTGQDALIPQDAAARAPVISKMDGDRLIPALADLLHTSGANENTDAARMPSRT